MARRLSRAGRQLASSRKRRVPTQRKAVARLGPQTGVTFPNSPDCDRHPKQCQTFDKGGGVTNATDLGRQLGPLEGGLADWRYGKGEHAILVWCCRRFSGATEPGRNFVELARKIFPRLILPRNFVTHEGI